MKYNIYNCEQYNVNDNSYSIVELFKQSGEIVKKGDIIISLDSSKAIIDIEADKSGIFYIRRKQGDSINTGEKFYLISDEEIEENKIDELLTSEIKNQFQTENIVSKVITKKAQKLIDEYKIDISLLEEEEITESIINAYLNRNNKFDKLIQENANFKKINRIAFIGAGQGLIQVLDALFSIGEFTPCCIYDDTKEKIGSIVLGIPVIGKIDFDSIANDYRDNKFDFIINTVSTSIPFRKQVFLSLTNLGVKFCNVIHPSVNIGFNSIIGSGNIILTNANIGACSNIGNNNFISAMCNIEHHNVLGNHCTFGPGVMTSGSVTINDEVKFGTGIFIEPKVVIGSRVVVSSGSIITRNISDDNIVYNNMKVSVKEKNHE